jgi:hypothetical protein
VMRRTESCAGSGVSRHRSSIHVLVLPYRESIHVVFAQKSPATDFGNYEFRYSETDIRFGFTFAVVWYSFTALYYPQHVYLSSSRFGPESLPRGRCIWKSATLSWTLETAALNRFESLLLALCMCLLVLYKMVLVLCPTEEYRARYKIREHQRYLGTVWRGGLVVKSRPRALQPLLPSSR